MVSNASPPATEGLKPSAAIAIVLATAAGCVDAMGYLLLGEVLVAHMSGNTAVGAVRLQRQNWTLTFNRLTPIPGFLVGIALGKLGVLALQQRRVRHVLPLALLAELLLLGGFIALAGWRPGARLPAIELLALAMGIQNAALHQAAGHQIRTTFVTGMLVSFVDESVDWILGRSRGEARPALHAGVWCGFFGGALMGAFATARWGPAATWVPMLLVSAAAVVDIVHPSGHRS